METLSILVADSGQDDSMAKKRLKTFADLPGGSETVLVVDDDNTVRSLILETLKMKGYRVLDAQFNSAALMLSGRHPGPIHLMIADVIMPGVNGRELARRLVSLRPDTRILYVSGYPRDMLAEENILEEDAPFLQKPISPEILLPKIRELLDDGGTTEQPESDQEDFIMTVVQSLLAKQGPYALSTAQTTQLQGLIADYEETRLACDAEFMVAELHVQTLVQDDHATLEEIEAALRKSEREQTRVRLEGIKVLRAAEGVLDADQRRRLIESYPHGRRRAGNRLSSP